MDVIIALRSNAELTKQLLAHLFSLFGKSATEDDRVADQLQNLLREVRMTMPSDKIQALLSIAQGNPSMGFANLLGLCGRTVCLEDVILGCTEDTRYREFGLVVLKGVVTEMTEQQDALYDLQRILDQLVSGLDPGNSVIFGLQVSCVQSILRFDMSKKGRLRDQYQRIADVVVSAGVGLIQQSQHRSNGLFTLRSFVEAVGEKVQWTELATYLIEQLATHGADGSNGPIGNSIGEILKLLQVVINKDNSPQLFQILHIAATWDTVGWFTRTNHALVHKHPRHVVDAGLRSLTNNLEAWHGRQRVREYLAWLCDGGSAIHGALCFFQYTVPSIETAQLVVRVIGGLVENPTEALPDIVEPILTTLRHVLLLLPQSPSEQERFPVAQAVELALKVTRICPDDATIDYELFQFLAVCDPTIVRTASVPFLTNIRQNDFGLMAGLFKAGALGLPSVLQVSTVQVVQQNPNALMLMSVFPAQEAQKLITLEQALDVAMGCYQSNMVEYFACVLRIVMSLNPAAALGIVRQILGDTQGPMREAVFEFLKDLTLDIHEMPSDVQQQFQECFQIATPATSQQSFLKAIATARLGQQAAFQSILMCVSFERMGTLLDAILHGFLFLDQAHQASPIQELKNKIAVDTIRVLEHYMLEYADLLSDQNDAFAYQEDMAFVRRVLLKYGLVQQEQ